MAKHIFELFKKQPKKDSLSTYEIITAANLKPGYGILSSDQSFELVDQEGNLVKRSYDEGSFAKSSHSNFNECGIYRIRQYVIHVFLFGLGILPTPTFNL